MLIPGYENVPGTTPSFVQHNLCARVRPPAVAPGRGRLRFAASAGRIA